MKSSPEIKFISLVMLLQLFSKLLKIHTTTHYWISYQIKIILRIGSKRTYRPCLSVVSTGTCFSSTNCFNTEISPSFVQKLNKALKIDHLIFNNLKYELFCSLCLNLRVSLKVSRMPGPMLMWSWLNSRRSRRRCWQSDKSKWSSNSSI